jgi:hypothetical protein
MTPILLAVSLAAADLGASGRVDFNREVRPILNGRCMACHGGVKHAGGISVQFREDILGKGDSEEPCVTPGNPGQSELIRRITTADEEDRMPREKPALTREEVEILTRWVKQGAHWDDPWSFVPPRPSPTPAVLTKSWVRNPIDAFVLARLEGAGLGPSAEADRATLLRRVTLDLTGLPPTAEETAAFLADRSPDAYERVVDRLLASPRFGERWASLWLDIARYGDSKALGQDSTRPIWPYRDWVIRAFNEDLPWDRFIVLQMAGDLLPGPERDPVPTGFHRLTKANDEGGTSDEEYRAYAVMDRVNTTWNAFMGLQMACAQCHGHPYDPLRHADYYGSYAFLNQTSDADAPDDRPTIPFPADPGAERRLRQALAGASGSEAEPLAKRLRELPTVRLPVLEELPAAQRRKTHVLTRGAWNNPGQPIAEAFTPATLHAFPKDQPRDRLGFARWIASPENPLTARVAVNYLWQELFGTGLVATSEDFGTMGEKPSHPELLDTLAHRFMHEWGWRPKRAIREMVLSATYRQTSRASDELRERDPGNRLLGRAARKRLGAEMVRDQALALAGLLNTTLTEGPPFVPPSPGGYLRNAFAGASEVRVTTDEGRFRRSVYGFWKRLEPFAVLTIFDASDRDACATRRITTNSPLQALATLNEEILVEAQKGLGRRLLGAGGDDAARVRAGFALIGDPTPPEASVRAVLALLADSRRAYAADPGLARKAGLTAEEAAWWQVATALLNSDTALNRD